MTKTSQQIADELLAEHQATRQAAPAQRTPEQTSLSHSDIRVLIKRHGVGFYEREDMAEQAFWRFIDELILNERRAAMDASAQGEQSVPAQEQQERIAELQYEAGMYKSLYDNLRAQVPDAVPVAWTNKAQLGYLKEPTYRMVPMAMWAKPSGAADIPLYSVAPAQPPQEGS
jgi:hypothetical protein